MRSLRLRFFLISWPLVVAAIGIVAFGVDRFTVVQLQQFENLAPRLPAQPLRAAWADALGAGWGSLPFPEGQALIARLVASQTPAVDVVVLDADGFTIISTDRGIHPLAESRGPGGAERSFRREQREGGLVSETAFTLPGVPVRDAAGAMLGAMFVFPKSSPKSEAPVTTATWHSRLRRTLWTTAGAASLAAAAAALLLAGPLVRQIRRLTTASASIRDGVLGARVEARGGDEIAELGRSFNAMASALENAEAHKRNLVTDVAHELRTPLTNIIGLLEAVQDGLRPPDGATLGSLREEAGLLEALVGELQELSLAESGQLAFDIERVDAIAAANAAVEAVRPVIGGVTVSGPAAAGPVFVKADARRLAQVLRNLLRNAITHTPDGGTVSVLVTSLPSRIAITVADTGRGIPPEHLALVWERFHRVDPSRDRASGGMGLGLALVRQLVAGMGGDVAVESEIGRGSRFTVELPV